MSDNDFNVNVQTPEVELPETAESEAQAIPSVGTETQVEATPSEVVDLMSDPMEDMVCDSCQ